MTAHRGPRPDRTDTPATIALVPGPITTAWCRLCKAWTRYEGSLLALTDTGVTDVGSWTWCETCNPDPRSTT